MLSLKYTGFYAEFFLQKIEEKIIFFCCGIVSFMDSVNIFGDDIIFNYHILKTAILILEARPIFKCLNK
jgi:hypothetical protein